MKIAGTHIEDPATSGRSFKEILDGLPTKSVSPDVAAFLTGTDVLEDGGAAAKMVTPYAQSSWVYIAVTRLAEKISSIPFRISRVGSGQASGGGHQAGAG